MKPLFLLLSIAMLAGFAPDPVTTRRDEARLLNQIIDPNHLGANLRVWDSGSNTWRESTTADLQKAKARVLVVNLWAHYCKPCVAEFPILRDMARHIEEDTKGEVRFVFISETSSPSDMQQFVAGNEKRLPEGPLLLDYNENIAETLRHVLPGRGLSLPTTIILDERRTVRYALIGALLHRRSELLSAIFDTVHALSNTSAN